VHDIRTEAIELFDYSSIDQRTVGLRDPPQSLRNPCAARCAGNDRDDAAAHHSSDLHAPHRLAIGRSLESPTTRRNKCHEENLMARLYETLRQLLGRTLTSTRRHGRVEAA
jgi:hypothetical protein